MHVRPITRFLAGFAAAFFVILWGEWMPDPDYVLSPSGWIVVAGIGALFVTVPRLWGE
jgi:hypothetical protein